MLSAVCPALLAVFLVFGVFAGIWNHRLRKMNSILRETNRRIESAANATAASIDMTRRKRREQASAERIRPAEGLENFAHAVAHDLREPLRGIRALTELFLKLNRSVLSEKSVQLLILALSSADRMNQLIESILEYAGGDEPYPNKTRVDTQALAKLALQHLRQAVEETSAKIRLGTLPIVVANEVQLLRVFQNLIGNAIKYHGESPPEIHMSASLNGENEWVFFVRDNGVGIDPSSSEKVFETYQRLDSAPECKGCGLGLAVCRRIVRRHGGRIWVESEPGRGSTFYFTLPNQREPERTVADGSTRRREQANH